MGMFDDITCKYPMPLAGANDLTYQTKDTDQQFLDQYEIREDGTFWHEEYDIEDHSDAADWQREHPGQEVPKELDRFCGCLSRTNKRWSEVKLTGEVVFYAMYSISADGKMTNATAFDGWLEWSCYFVDGKVSKLNLIENSPPNK